MGDGKGSAEAVFLGLSREQVAKIIYEELSKSGFQFNNFNAVVPSIINRALAENIGMAGNNLTGMIIKGMMDNFFKK